MLCLVQARQQQSLFFFTNYNKKTNVIITITSHHSIRLYNLQHKFFLNTLQVIQSAIQIFFTVQIFFKCIVISTTRNIFKTKIVLEVVQSAIYLKKVFENTIAGCIICNVFIF